jgi:hypothetical protein
MLLTRMEERDANWRRARVSCREAYVVTLLLRFGNADSAADDVGQWSRFPAEYFVAAARLVNVNPAGQLKNLRHACEAVDTNICRADSIFFPRRGPDEVAERKNKQQRDTYYAPAHR